MIIVQTKTIYFVIVVTCTLITFKRNIYTSLHNYCYQIPKKEIFFPSAAVDKHYSVHISKVEIWSTNMYQAEVILQYQCNLTVANSSLTAIGYIRYSYELNISYVLMLSWKKEKRAENAKAAYDLKCVHSTYGSREPTKTRIALWLWQMNH